MADFEFILEDIQLEFDNLIYDCIDSLYSLNKCKVENVVIKSWCTKNRILDNLEKIHELSKEAAKIKKSIDTNDNRNHNINNICT